MSGGLAGNVWLIEIGTNGRGFGWDVMVNRSIVWIGLLYGVVALRFAVTECLCDGQMAAGCLLQEASLSGPRLP